MNLFLVIALLITTICFGGVILVGAPYLPSLSDHQKNAFKLLNLKKGQTVLELGVGDGRVAIYAARKGLKVVGYELNPVLCMLAKIRTWKYRKNVQIIWGNFWHKKWPKSDAIYVFLLPKYMNKLHDKCLAYKSKPLLVASVAFEIEDYSHFKYEHGVFLYKYK